MTCVHHAYMYIGEYMYMHMYPFSDLDLQCDQLNLCVYIFSRFPAYRRSEYRYFILLCAHTTEATMHSIPTTTDSNTCTAFLTSIDDVKDAINRLRAPAALIAAGQGLSRSVRDEEGRNKL